MTIIHAPIQYVCEAPHYTCINQTQFHDQIEEALKEIQIAKYKLVDPSDVYTHYWLLGQIEGLSQAVQIFETSLCD